jgi:hypothetical protein
MWSGSVQHEGKLLLMGFGFTFIVPLGRFREAHNSTYSIAGNEIIYYSKKHIFSLWAKQLSFP